MNEVFWFQLHNAVIDAVELAKFVFIIGAFYALKRCVNIAELYATCKLKVLVDNTHYKQK